MTHVQNRFYLERVEWPALAHRFPTAVEGRNANAHGWVYELAELDGNWEEKLEFF